MATARQNRDRWILKVNHLTKIVIKKIIHKVQTHLYYG